MRRTPAIGYAQQPSAGSGGELGQPQVFIQETEPVASYPWLWVVTDAAGNPTGEQRVHYGGSIGPVDVDAIQALVDAKGELLAGLGADLLGRVPAGTEGQVLTARAAAAAGVQFEAPAGVQAIPPVPNVIAPGGSVEVFSSNSSPGVNTLRGQRVIVPSGATRLRELWAPVSTAGGNLRGAIYDIGATTSATRTRIYDGASTAAVLGWTLLGDANIAVTGGQHLDFTVIGDNAAIMVGRRTLAGGIEEALPAAVAMVGGCLYKTAWSNSPGSFTNPATLNEAAAATSVSGVYVLIARFT